MRFPPLSVFPLILVVFCVLLARSDAHGQGFTFTRGDVNGDTSIDVSDPVLLLLDLFVAGSTPIPCDDAADANDDGSTDVADVIAILAYLFQGGPPLPLPNLCGIDPTPDSLTCASSPSGCPLDLSPFEALYEPPSPPPAAPCGCFYQEGGLNSGVHKVLRHSGEAYHVETDLFLGGRGMDFAFTRTYRSRTGLPTAMGHNWTHSYDIHMAFPQSEVVLYDGHGRIDRLTQQSDGTYGAPGHFSSGEFNADGRFVLTFGDGGSWRFVPTDPVLPEAGKIDRIEDRHGNAMTFAYDGLGRLILITDTLGHVQALSYDGSGRITSLTDFDGRVVAYQYDGAGNLISVTGPPVVGTPTGNDFPLGKTTTYLYSSGYADDRLNHNLLSITDPKGQSWLELEYSASTDPADPTFDQAVSQSEAPGTPAGSKILIHIEGTSIAPDPTLNDATIVAVENDGRGLVTESYFDAENRRVVLREFTGFAAPLLESTLLTNRPTGKLRPTDPDFFETRYSYDADHLVTEEIAPNGTISQYLRESALVLGGPRVSRGNIRQITRLPGTHTPVGDQSVLIETREYEPGFGGCCAHDFATLLIDPAGRTTHHSYDASGNRIQTIHPDATVVEDYAYNLFGQLVAHVLPGDGTGPGRTDLYAYGTGGNTLGRLVSETVDALGTLLTTQFAYDPRGNITAVVDPTGASKINVYNQLDQRVLELSPVIDPAAGTRIERSYYHDANDNLVRTCSENRNEGGLLDPGNSYITTLYEYDRLNRLIRTCEESGSFDVPISPPQLDCQGLPASEFVTTEYQYDGNGNRTRTRHGEATNGTQPNNVVASEYDERDLPYRTIAGEGGVDASTTQFDYDGNENLVRHASGLESGSPRVSGLTYDAYDRLLSRTDPMGNVTTFEYDASGNLVHEQTDGELTDLSGDLANVLLQESRIFVGDLSRPSGGQFTHFDPVTRAPLSDGFSSWGCGYAPTSRITSLTDDDGASTTYEYDSLERLSRSIDPFGNEQVFGYDPRGNVVMLTEVHVSTDPTVVPETFVTTFTYDDLSRLTSVTDNAGAVSCFGYDSRNNRVRVIDARGNVTRYVYDSLDRQVAVHRRLTDSGVGTGTVLALASTLYQWDDSSRLTSIIDPNGNPTTYAYDDLDRRVLTTYADGTGHVFVWDSHSDLVSETDPNGTVVVTNYDALGRPILRTVAAGPGVATTTTFETFEYDGLGRLVRTTDDDSEVLRSYDSLGNLVAETLNGQLTTHLRSASGKQLSTTYPGGRTIAFSYDALGRLTAITDPTGGPVISAYEYIGPTRVLRSTNGAAMVRETDFDFVRRISATTHTATALPIPVLDERSFGYDDVHNITVEQQFAPGAPDEQHQFTYDSLNRLVRAQVTDSAGSPLRDTQYFLDLAGNRQEVSSGSCSGPYVLDPVGGTVHQYALTGCDQRSYDAAGNLASRAAFGAPAAQYSYDYRDRLVEVIDPFSGMYSYEYDPLGRRIARTHLLVTGPERTEYFYDADAVIEEQNGFGGTLATYVYGNRLDEMIQMQRDFGLGVGPETFYSVVSELQGIVVLCNTAGEPVERYSYGDYGEPTILDATGVPLAASQYGNPYLFQGRRYDPETGWYLFPPRALDPIAGRFVGRDPNGVHSDAQGLGNGYTFHGNNPGSAEGMIWGEWGGSEPSSPSRQTSKVVVRGWNPTHRLTRGGKSKTWADSSDQQLVTVARDLVLVAAGTTSTKSPGERVMRPTFGGGGIPNDSASMAAPYIPGGAVVSAAVSGIGQLESRAVLNQDPLEYRAHLPEPPPWWGPIGNTSPQPPSTGSLRTASNLPPIRWMAPESLRKRPGRVKYGDITLKRGYSLGDDPLLRKRPGRVKYGNITLKRGYSLGEDLLLRKRPGRVKYGDITLKRGHVLFSPDGTPIRAKVRTPWMERGGELHGFEKLSGIMKTMHDTAKSAINNVR